MSVEEYLKLVKMAWDVAEKSPEQVKKDVFNLTYSSLLHTISESEHSPIEHVLNSSDKPTKTSFEQKNIIFAKKCNLNVNDLKDIFYIDEQGIHLLVNIKGTDAEKQAIAAQCILTAYQLLFDKEWVSAPQLKKNIVDSNIEGMDHFARNLRRRKNILVRGKGKGVTLEYKISGVGKLEAFEIIHDLVKGDL